MFWIVLYHFYWPESQKTNFGVGGSQIDLQLSLQFGKCDFGIKIGLKDKMLSFNLKNEKF